MIFCPQLPSPGITHCTLTTVRYGTPRLTLSSRRGGFKHWASLWGIKFSVAKCIGVVFTRRNVPDLQLTLQGQPIPFQNLVKFLGLHFDSRLNWKIHINELLIRCRKKINVLKHLRATSWGADRKIFINGVQVLNSLSFRLWLTGVWVWIGTNIEDVGCFAE